MQNLHPVMQQALAPFAPRSALTEYHAALSKFDWGFELSDDARRVEQKRKDLAALLEMQREVDQDGSIWMSYVEGKSFTAALPYVDTRTIDLHKAGDPLPRVGTRCLVSTGSKFSVCDDSGENVIAKDCRTFAWKKVLGYSDDLKFIIFQVEPGVFPTVEKTRDCAFASIESAMQTMLTEEEAL